MGRTLTNKARLYMVDADGAETFIGEVDAKIKTKPKHVVMGLEIVTENSDDAPAHIRRLIPEDIFLAARAAYLEGDALLAKSLLLDALGLPDSYLLNFKELKFE